MALPLLRARWTLKGCMQSRPGWSPGPFLAASLSLAWRSGLEGCRGCDGGGGQARAPRASFLQGASRVRPWGAGGAKGLRPSHPSSHPAIQPGPGRRVQSFPGRAAPKVGATGARVPRPAALQGGGPRRGPRRERGPLGASSLHLGRPPGGPRGPACLCDWAGGRPEVWGAAWAPAPGLASGVQAALSRPPGACSPVRSRARAARRAEWRLARRASCLKSF